MIIERKQNYMPHLTSRLKPNTKQPVSKVLFLVAAVFAFVGLGSAFAPLAHAVLPPGSGGDALSAYCRDKAGKAQNACDDENFANSGNDLINATVNVATYHCENKSTQDAETDCIIDTAKRYIRKAADDDHSSAAKFKTTLHAVLDDAGGSLQHPSSQSILGGAAAPLPSGADGPSKSAIRIGAILSVST